MSSIYVLRELIRYPEPDSNYDYDCASDYADTLETAFVYARHYGYPEPKELVESCQTWIAEKQNSDGSTAIFEITTHYLFTIKDFDECTIGDRISYHTRIAVYHIKCFGINLLFRLKKKDYSKPIDRKE